MRYVIKKGDQFFAGFNKGKPTFNDKPLKMGKETAHQQASTLSDVEVVAWTDDKSMMKYRPHKGGLADSMALAQDFEGIEGLLTLIRKELESFNVDLEISESTVSVKPYGFDNRIGWDSHIVTLEGYGVLGFTNGAVSKHMHTKED